MTAEPQPDLKLLTISVAASGSEAAEVSFSLPDELMGLGERAKAGFHLAAGSDKGLSRIELALLFIQHLVKTEHEILAQVFTQFHEAILGGQDPHVAFCGRVETLGFPAATRIFYEARTKLNIINATMPEALSVQPMALFGGQACSEDLLGELQQVLTAYHPLVKSYYSRLAGAIKSCAEDRVFKETMLSGFDVERWLEDAKAQPSKEYLLSAPISLPLVGFIQLMNYYALQKALSMTPEGLVQCFGGATGHSQGIIPAAMIAVARTEEEFICGSEDTVKTLFWIGLRSHLVCAQMPLQPDIVKDCVEHGEGPPSPMLSISGLPRAVLEETLGRLNDKAPNKVTVRLKNGANAFVCCGPLLDLYNAVLALRGIQSGDEDQSRVPYADRKHRFSLRFLPISAPFHSGYLAAAVPLVLDDLARHRCEFFTGPRQPMVPVLHTETGTRPQAASNLTGVGRPLEFGAGCLRELVEQICVKPVDWPRSTQGHAAPVLLDFGPGHAGGIGSLTQRNIEGSGVQVAVGRPAVVLTALGGAGGVV